jgi:hypothetical protein
MQSFTGEGNVTGGKFSSKIKASGVKVNRFSVDKVEIASKGTVKAEGKFAGVVKGLDLTFAVEDGTAASGAAISAKVGGEFSSDLADVTASVDVAKGPSAHVSAMFSKGSAHFGAKASMNTAELSKGLGAFSAYDFLLGYTNGGLTGAVEVNKKLSSLRIAAHHKGESSSFIVDTSVGLAGKGAAKDTAPKKLMDDVKVRLGGSYKYDSALTLLADVDQAGTLRVATENKVSNMATLTLGGSVDLTAIGRDVHSVSTKLSISA